MEAKMEDNFKVLFTTHKIMLDKDLSYMIYVDVVTLS